MIDFVVAVALILVIEGAVYALFPAGMKRLMAWVLDEPESTLRTAGLIAVVIGVGVVWLVRG